MYNNNDNSNNYNNSNNNSNSNIRTDWNNLVNPMSPSTCNTVLHVSTGMITNLHKLENIPPRIVVPSNRYDSAK